MVDSSFLMVCGRLRAEFWVSFVLFATFGMKLLPNEEAAGFAWTLVSLTMVFYFKNGLSTILFDVSAY